MELDWNDAQPIYRQLRDRVVAMMLDGDLREGDPLPSVRQVASDLRVNPLTVLKSYQGLVDEQLIEKRRGLGMFVRPGARAASSSGRARTFSEHRMASRRRDHSASRDSTPRSCSQPRTTTAARGATDHVLH